MKSSDAKHLFHRFNICRIDNCYMCQISFSLIAFFSQNMTFKSMLSFNLPGSSQSKSFLCATYALHLRHSFFVLMCFRKYNIKISTYFLGAITTIIFLPSSLGADSTFPYSSNSPIKRSSNLYPWSLNRMDLPLKKT